MILLILKLGFILWSVMFIFWLGWMTCYLQLNKRYLDCEECSRRLDNTCQFNVPIQVLEATESSADSCNLAITGLRG